MGVGRSTSYKRVPGVSGNRIEEIYEINICWNSEVDLAGGFDFYVTGMWVDISAYGIGLGAFIRKNIFRSRLLPVYGIPDATQARAVGSRNYSPSKGNRGGSGYGFSEI